MNGKETPTFLSEWRDGNRLVTWYDLPDVRRADALEDRVSFCGFAGNEPTPERTAVVRFRAARVRRGLDRVLFDAVTRQLDTLNLVMRTGTLVGATRLPPACIRHDAEARWAGHRRCKPTQGDKAMLPPARKPA